MAAATVVGPPWVQQAVSPSFLGQSTRDILRRGASMNVIRLDREGGVRLIPASNWHWEGNHDPASWTVRVTCYGPSTSTTWNLPASGVVFLRWGSAPGQPYIGTGPTDWAHTTARLNAAAEKSLADEAGGPVAQLLTVPEGNDAGSDDDSDPLAGLRADIAAAKGRALLVESSNSGYGEGKANAPQRDFDPRALHPTPDAGLVQVADQAFMRVLAACGTPPALFTGDADGTSQREALRRWHLGTVLPIARMIEHELSEKLDVPVRLKFDSYPRDQVSRAQVFSKLIAAEGMTKEMALAISGLMDNGDG